MLKLKLCKHDFRTCAITCGKQTHTRQQVFNYLPNSKVEAGIIRTNISGHFVFILSETPSPNKVPSHVKSKKFISITNQC